MRIVSWNCNMALHRKITALQRLKPSVAVIPECAEPERLKERAPQLFQDSIAWVGKNPNKGLGVFGFGDYEVELHPSYDSSIPIIAPIVVTGRRAFHLLAVWASTGSEHWGREKPGPFLDAIERYDGFVREAPTIIAGDLNNHVRWDKPGYAGNHSNALAKVGSLGLFSAYHYDRGVEHGDESEPTHYWRDRKKDGPTYHLDYVFVPRLWISKMREMTIGSFEDWCGSGLSDHVPLVVDLDLSGAPRSK